MRKFISSSLALMMVVGAFFMPMNQKTAVAASGIRGIVSNMTTQQKVAQMIMPALRTWGSGDDAVPATTLSDEQKAVLTKYSFGGVIIFGQNIEEAGQTTQLISSMQEANAMGGAVSSLLVSIDQEGGYITRLSTGTSMPGNMAIAATNDPDNAYLAGDVIGSELSVQGINVDFAPVMDVNNNPSNPIIGVRSFSDDPKVVSQYGARFIEGLHNNHVMVALKHFPGHGDTDTDSHTGLPLIEKTYDQLKNLELIPFTQVASSADFVMTAHIQYPNIETGTYTSISTGEEVYLPATLSKTILTDILRKDIGFEGVIVTDAMEMDAIASHFDPMDAARLAINAGANMLLIPVDISSPDDIKELDDYINGIVAGIDNGLISMDCVNDSVYRILKAKSKYGLMNDDSLNELGKSELITPDPELARQVVGSKEHHDIEWKIALEAVTSIKNDNAYPVTDDKKTVILYSNDNQKNSIDFAKALLVAEGKVTSPDNIISICAKDASKESLTAAIKGADTVIMLSVSYSKEASNEDLIHDLIQKTHDNGGKFILLSAHLPYELASFADADALIACYNSRGMEMIPTGESNRPKYGANIPAAIYAIFGGSDITGTLPVSIN
ncbi:beta-N-acetylhexosaminidase [Butyrivibrio fibrisolvens]|uniref:beta-N-acetylhexosaminidase n=1 Tax=Butyrivibrio fibrisolvens TaxID=831 RepID=A0A1H9TVA9_BUTFI|nr:glycoside hydrolase family 3 N-terminal domain-containing protein [Butyrivibrio fibrisolvens]SES01175.1 beta-N-acetylhexosaminidase [Butyrivibrio fibrisolvens]